MKKISFLLLSFGLLAFALQAQTSTSKSTNKNSNTKDGKREVIIEEKSGGKNEKTVIVIDGDKVTINGKPADQYKGKKHIVIDDELILDGNKVIIPKGPKGPKGPKAPMVASTNMKPRAFLGVVSEKTDKGAKVTEVVEESAAEKAGLKAGDIITKVNTTAISGDEQLAETIRKFKPEEVVDLTYLREGKERKVKATLGKSNAMVWSGDWDNDDFMKDFHFDIDPPMAFTAPNGQGYFSWNGRDGNLILRDGRPKYGMAVEDNADGDGVKISSVDSGSNAAKAGLRKDDIITAVNDSEIKNLDELREALDDSREASTVQLKVLRAGKPETFTLRVPKRIKSADL